MIIPSGMRIMSDVINSNELNTKLYNMNNTLAMMIELTKEFIIAFLSYFISPNLYAL